MHRLLVAALLLLAWVPSALAGPLVVWMEGQVPDEKAVEKANKRVGHATHLAHVDLAFPPQPNTRADEQRYAAVRTAVADGRKRWDEFDVELDIAVELEAALAAIDVVRGARDLQDLVDARLFQGAAVAKAFPPDGFLTAAEAEPFRMELPGLKGNRPWVLAMGLDPRREFTRADVADGAAFPELQALQDKVEEMPDGSLDFSAVPPGASVVVDGHVLGEGVGGVELRPGLHYVHVIRNEVVGGRTMVRIEPGASGALPLAVGAVDLDKARSQVLAGTTSGFPAPVKEGMESLMAYYEGSVFVAAVDDGKVEVLPYARQAELLRRKPVTFLGVGEMGGGVVVSPLFDEAAAETVTAPGASGGLGLELGIYNLAILGGFDLAFTPAHTVTHANSELTDNVKSSVLPQPWGGLGAYVLRPTGPTPVLLLAATYGWDYPAHMALGGRLTFATPIEDDGTWFRLTVGGNTAAQPMKEWRADYADVPMHTLFLRVGLGTAFI